MTPAMPAAAGASFSRAARTYHAASSVQRRAAFRAAELLRNAGGTRFGTLLELGAGTGHLTEALLDAAGEDALGARLTVTDAAGAMLDVLRDRLEERLPPQTFFTVAAMETAASRPDIAERGPYDLIAMGSVLQWAEDPRAVLSSLKPLCVSGGRLLLTVYASGTLREIRELAGRGLSLPDVDGWIRIGREAGWSLTASREDLDVERFPNALTALRHLSDTGVNARPAAGSPMTSGALRELMQNWERRFAHPEGGVTLTWRSAALLFSCA